LVFALSLLFSSCSADGVREDTTDYVYKTKSILLECDFVDMVNGEIKLSVKNDRGESISPRDVIFESSDYGVAAVSKDGIVYSLSGGRVSITATLREDMTITTTSSLFVPYKVSEPKSSTVVDTSELIDSSFSGMSDFLAKYGFKVVKASFFSKLPVGLLINFFSKDVYQFSMFERTKVAEDILLYDLTGWTNEAVYINETNLDSSQIYSYFCESVGIPESLVGNSFDDALEPIKNVVNSTRIKDYFFNEMDDAYEYRIVIRGNCEYVRNKSFYSNGLLTGFGMSVLDLAKLDFGSISENYTYTKVFDEILNITNLQICLEYRSK
jgi:hypothetical protein